MSVVLVTDSGCDLERDEAARKSIEIVPIYILFGKERLRDGVDIDRTAFFRRMAAGEVPKTEPVAVADYESVFRKHADAGDTVVCLTISSHISQSCANAKAAAAAFADAVHVVDSRGASGMQLLLALYAAELVKQGKGAAEIARAVSPEKITSATYFAVPQMTQLGLSGRLPKAVVALGSMLNVSLVLKMNESGAIGPAGQSRSFERTCDIMVDAVVRSIERSPDARIAVSHVQSPVIARTLSEAISQKLGHRPAFETVNEATLTIATHLGAGAVGIFAIVP